VVLSPLDPAPPPVELIGPKEELVPGLAAVGLDNAAYCPVDPAPPPPTVIVIGEPAVAGYPVAVK
jgi:hypothetical protein